MHKMNPTVQCIHDQCRRIRSGIFSPDTNPHEWVTVQSDKIRGRPSGSLPPRQVNYLTVGGIRAPLSDLSLSRHPEGRFTTSLWV